MIPSFPTFPQENLNFKNDNQLETLSARKRSLEAIQAAPNAGKKPY